MQVFQVWLQRGVLAQKVLEPHMQQLQQLKASSEAENHEPRAKLSAREAGPPAMSWLTADREEITQGAQLDEFGCAAASLLCPNKDNLFPDIHKCDVLSGLVCGRCNS